MHIATGLESIYPLAKNMPTIGVLDSWSTSEPQWVAGAMMVCTQISYRPSVLMCCAFFFIGCEKTPEPGPEAPPAEVSRTPASQAPPEENLPPPSCAPQQELCNDLDDDCDGGVDELADVRLIVYEDPDNCGVCGHRCQAPRGQTACIAGLCVIRQCEDGYSNANGEYEDGCEARCIPSGDGVEVCDGADNDCDGTLDEGFDLRLDPENCGGCNQRCSAAPQTEVQCLEGRCQTQGCKEEWYDLNGVRADGCEYACTLRSTDEVVEFCNGLDDDCDGLADESADLEAPSIACASEGACAPQCESHRDCSNDEICDPRGACVPRQGGPEETPCETDDQCASMHRNYVCVQHNHRVAGRWVREGWCQARSFSAFCVGASGWQCPSGAGGGNDNEQGLCDGSDNDCDGRIDEDFTADLFLDGSGQEPKTCHEGLGACRIQGTVMCAADGQGTACDAIPSEPLDTIDDQCDGIDQDCDGNIDEDFADALVDFDGFSIYAYEASKPGGEDGAESTDDVRGCSRPDTLPWNNLSWGEAQTACQEAGARLCTPDEWSRACGGPAPLESYTYGPDFITERCNHAVGLEGQPELEAAGADELCQRAGVFDLTGNVKEWVDETDGNSRALRGGAYSTPVESGLTCAQDGDWKDRNFRNPAIGFRCCRDPQP